MPTSAAKQGEMYRAGTPALSPRLAAAAAMVRPGVPVADIGCDHGKLAVYLVKAGIAPRVIAGDISPMPLARARALAAQTGCEAQVDCRLGGGLDVVRPGEAQDIVIAGMSGETMIEIISQADAQMRVGLRLVLVPVTRHAQLRRWLCERGFALLAERLVEDAGRLYPVMSWEYTGEPQAAAPLFCELGLQAGGDELLAARYRRERLAYLRSRTLAPLEAEERAALENLIQEVEQCPE